MEENDASMLQDRLRRITVAPTLPLRILATIAAVLVKLLS
jgi:hypothetical protein